MSFPNHANAISSWFKLAMNELGLKEILGFTGGHLLGFQYLTLSIDRETQTRSSSEASYLRKALGLYDNLTVYTSALAKKIIFDGDKRATGVIVNSAGMNYTLTAKKEVILSAGAFRSPQLLMVSGVGPKETLAKFDIEVLADRPGIGQVCALVFLAQLSRLIRELYDSNERRLTCRVEHVGPSPIFRGARSRCRDSQSARKSFFCGCSSGSLQHE